MSREEAWNRIDAIIAKHEIDDDYVTITSLLDYDALRLARKLLEQEHCEDAISRQAVLDQTYLWSRDEFLRVTNPFDYLRKRINSLPFVTSEEKVSRSENPNKLIPVSEELSNNDAALCDNCPCKTDTCQEGLHCPMDE